MPVAHLLALAPLDVWIRMLLKHGPNAQPIKPRYWIRLLGIGTTSLVGTMCSTPERLLFGIIRKLSSKDPERFEHPPGVLVIVGYYRSGTTHVHNLISCDPKSTTPPWYQALLGQGFWLSWGLTRFLLVPFLGSSRPQDGVGFGPRWPAEDDFALAGWGMCSTLPGRLIFPSRWETWKRWNALEECTDRERARWRRTMAGFAWKVTRRHPDRMLVLKTPSHGAHITELVEVFGEHVRFIHVSRDPIKVIDSNMRMHDALADHLLEDQLEPSILRERILDEYLEIENQTRIQSQSLPQGRIAYLAHEHVLIDPIGQLREALDSLGHPMSDEHESSIGSYLNQLGEYDRPAQAPIDLGEPAQTESAKLEELRELRPIDPQDIPSNPVPIPEPSQESRTPKLWIGVLSSIASALLFAAFWIGLIWIIKLLAPEYKPRLDQLAWVSGMVIGIAAVKAAGGGSRKLGLVAVLLVPIVFWGLSFPITVINWHWARGESLENFLYHNGKGALHGVLASSSIVFMVLGMLTAWRHASYDGPKPPGR